MNRFIASIVLSLIALSSAKELQAVAAGTTAPAYELVTFSGETYSNYTQKGRPVLLVFWAPWCKVCQRDLPLLSEFYRRDKPGQLGVVSIGFADTRTNVERFVKERSGTFVYPTAYDEDRWVAQAFKVNATPTYVLLDAQGSVVLVHRGGGVLQNPQFREFLSTLNGCGSKQRRGHQPSPWSRKDDARLSFSDFSPGRIPCGPSLLFVSLRVAAGPLLPHVHNRSLAESAD
ncbi:MAG: TlpA disulfide reductase family protein [Nitrospirota bacterium]